MIIKEEKILFEPVWIGFPELKDGYALMYRGNFSFDLDLEQFYNAYKGVSTGVPKRGIHNLCVL